jgi:hypothetical protein
MISCRNCQAKFLSQKLYVNHMHMHILSGYLQCGISDCHWKGFTYSSFQRHIFFSHKTSHLKEYHDISSSSVNNLKCPITGCSTKAFKSVKVFLVHFYGHFEDETEIACPFEGCSKIYKYKNSLQVHVHRNHKTMFPGIMNDTPHIDHPLDNYHTDMHVSHAVTDCNEPIHELSVENEGSTMVVSDEHELLTTTAKFYMNLQVKHFLPSISVQTIMENMMSLYRQNSVMKRRKTAENLKTLGFTREQVESVINSLNREDTFENMHNLHHGVLRSIKSRLTYFKSTFGYVGADAYGLGINSNGKEAYCHYVSIEKSLKQLLSMRNMNSVLYNYEDSCLSGIYRDFKDGSFYKGESNIWNGDTLQLIIYHDDLELVNPLGSAKSRHKIYALYYSVANIRPEHRSGCDHMQLLLLAKACDVKYFGIKKVLQPFVMEMKRLIQDNISIDFSMHTYKCRILAVVGDHLAHHLLCSLPQNFSSGYVCQFCDATLDKIRDGHWNASYYNVRTDEDMEAGCALNELEHFSSANQVLPCIAHDLLEGVVAHDLMLCLQYFVNKKKWMTQEYIRASIQLFPFKYPDSNNKPVFTSLGAKRIAGTAAQLWTFLRFLPFFINVRDISDDVWQMVQDLMYVTQILLSPAIHECQINVLRCMLNDYITHRSILFPQVPLRPKHHYLTHYPDIIKKFGPPIRFWTLRFESKHRYFKNTVRCAQNFINITATLSERHQLAQALHVSVSPFKLDVILREQVYEKCLTPTIKQCICHLQKASYCRSVEVCGTLYKEGMVVVISRESSISLNIGCINLIVVDSKRNILFILQKGIATKNSLGCYELNTLSEDVQLVQKHTLLCDYPLNIYYFRGAMRCLVLKHSVVDDFY